MRWPCWKAAKAAPASRISSSIWLRHGSQCQKQQWPGAVLQAWRRTCGAGWTSWTNHSDRSTTQARSRCPLAFFKSLVVRRAVLTVLTAAGAGTGCADRVVPERRT